MIQLQLEGVANYDVQQRLKQVRSIVKDALSGTQDAIKLASKEAEELEDKVNSDAINSSKDGAVDLRGSQYVYKTAKIQDI
jgi:hypothetical protein